MLKLGYTHAHRDLRVQMNGEAKVGSVDYFKPKRRFFMVLGANDSKGILRLSLLINKMLD